MDKPNIVEHYVTNPEVPLPLGSEAPFLALPSNLTNKKSYLDIDWSIYFKIGQKVALYMHQLKSVLTHIAQNHSYSHEKLIKSVFRSSLSQFKHLSKSLLQPPGSPIW